MKKIITFLGTGEYKSITYSYESINIHTRFIQEAISDIIGRDAEIIVGLTRGAREVNWKELESIFINKNISYRTINIFDGYDNEEIWGNFNLLFEELDEGDEIYFDVTHSFRSIPLIVMSVLNYGRFIKNIEIKDIYYGAFEAMRDGVAPIFNLSIFNQITDWTIGAEKFINTGDSRQLSSMIDTIIRPILKETKGKNEDAQISQKIRKALEDFSGGLYTVRGNKMSEYGATLKDALESVKNIDLNGLRPFEKVLDKIYEKVYFYSDDLVKDIHNTVKLCRDLGLIQQAYTFLRENIVNFLCIKGDIDIKNTKKRELVETILLSSHQYKNIVLDHRHKEIEEKIENYVNSELAHFFDDLGQDYRNDINHGGYRQDSKGYKSFEESLDKFILTFEHLILDDRVVSK